MNLTGYYVGWYECKALGDYYVCRYMGMVTTHVGWVFDFANNRWFWALKNPNFVNNHWPCVSEGDQIPWW